MTEAFDGDWLDQREPFDAMARDIDLAVRLADALPARPRILDLGAGTGSLFRWLAPLIGRAQAWTLVDADIRLIERAFDTIADRADEIGLTVTMPGRRTMLVHAPGGAWRIEGLIADLNGAPGNLPLVNADAVVNSALCDLVSEDWVQRMAAGLAVRRIPFYAALNVSGRDVFTPPHRADALVARGFRRDQLRDKGFSGRALGPAAPAAIAAAFAARGFAVATAPSDWRIPRQASAMAADLATGHTDAAMQQEHRHRAAIGAWEAARLRQAMEGRLSVRVGHRDVLALPG
ncbi:class I SAM-dependent methyltransferase [Humitalea sp. 24SJ18S-53]|uniref:class I SAM-dependent methyltransferase n=1 Tax=Humitalea sp. 24SJ18S-53 TaxID=3422307 RepID=UPI003D672DF0